MVAYSGRQRSKAASDASELQRPERDSGTQRINASRLKARVLVVDDDPLVAESVRRQLTRAGYEVLIVGNPYAALSAVIDDSFDVVVSDITMPGIDGIQLLQLIREHDARLPVVLFTGAPQVATAVSALEHGAFHYLIKPTPMNEVLSVIDRAVRTHELARVRDDLGVVISARQGGVSSQKDLITRFQRALCAAWIAYQPIVRAGSGELFGYEAFVRSDDADLCEPRALVAAAIAADRVTALGRVVRARVAHFLDGEPSDCAVFVNVHLSDLSDPMLLADESPVARHASRLVLEVADHSASEHTAAVRELTTELRRKGYRIAIDDMGAGYGALNSFALIEPDVVKVDMSLVRGIHASPTKKKLVRSMVSLCRELGTTLVAKGVETVEEEAALCELGCDLLQGYLYSTPRALGG
jgi:EAL domain-containing protein (putative c-di-GMP-specific phosphodiesterase class I)